MNIFTKILKLNYFSNNVGILISTLENLSKVIMCQSMERALKECIVNNNGASIYYSVS